MILSSCLNRILLFSVLEVQELKVIVCDNHDATDNDTAYTLGEGKG